MQSNRSSRRRAWHGAIPRGAKCHSPRAALPDAKMRLLAFELRPLRTAHVVVTCRQPDTRDDDAATGYHAVRAAVYRLPDANSPAAKRVGASGGEDRTVQR